MGILMDWGAFSGFGGRSQAWFAVITRLARNCALERVIQYAAAVVMNRDGGDDRIPAFAGYYGSPGMRQPA
jgi:hypothetical protein